jgi:catechol-2,3-dioxygenase
MDRKILEKVINFTPVTSEELFSFVYDYVKDVKGVEPTATQMTGIVNAIHMGIFSIIPAGEYYIKKLGLQVTRTYGIDGALLHTDIIDGN